MKTLKEIKSFAKKHNACKAQYKKFIEFINNNDELSAWQTVLGNIDWLQDEGLKISIKKVVKKANGVAKTWHNNGQIEREYSVNENGELDGIYRRWWSNGNLYVKCTYKDGLFDGLYRRWHDNGQLCEQSTYKDDKLDGLYREWYDDGKLHEECVFKDGIKVINE